jgi:phenylpyruvate tautomerase PptA (4-oxalocrotonate tautomerase family)
MPLIRINCPQNSFTAEQKAKLVPLLVDALMRQEVDPVTEAGKERTLCVFDEIATHNAFLAQR